MDEKLILTLEIDTKSGKVKIGDVEKGLKKVDDGLKKVQKTASKTSRGLFTNLQKMTIVLNQSAELLSKAARVLTMMAKPLQESGQFESFRITIENLTGDVGLAHERFQEMVNFAATTPFTVPGIVEAGNRLEALGRYSLDTIRMLGDLAAAAGKNVSQAVEAYTNLVTGRTGMAVKQFRAMLISTSDWTNKIGKKVLSQGAGVKASLDEMLSALPELIEEKGFAGMMEKQSQTLLGIWSNLEDAWQRFLAGLGDEGLEETKDLLKRVIDVLDQMGQNTKELTGYLKTLALVFGIFVGGGLLKKGVALFQGLWKSIVLTAGGVKALITGVNVLKLTFGGWVTALITVATYAWLAYEAFMGWNEAMEENITDTLKATHATIGLKEAEEDLLEVDAKKYARSIKISNQLKIELGILKDLTEGTEEYNEQNNKVIELQNDLIRIYPQLSLSTNNVLTDTGALTNFMEDLAAAAFLTKNAIEQLGEELDKFRLESRALEVEKTFGEIFDKFGEESYAGQWATRLKKDLSILTNIGDLTLGDLDSYDNDVKNFMLNVGLLVKVVSDSGKFDALEKKGLFKYVTKLGDTLTELKFEKFGSTMKNLLDGLTEDILEFEASGLITAEDKLGLVDIIRGQLDDFDKYEVDESKLSDKAKEVLGIIDTSFIRVIVENFDASRLAGFSGMMKNLYNRLLTTSEGDTKTEEERVKEQYKNWNEDFKKLVEEKNSAILALDISGADNKNVKIANLEKEFGKNLLDLHGRFAKDYVGIDEWKDSNVQKLQNSMYKAIIKSDKEFYEQKFKIVEEHTALFSLQNTPIEEQLKFYTDALSATKNLLNKEAAKLFDEKTIDKLESDQVSQLKPVVLAMYETLRQIVYDTTVTKSSEEAQAAFLESLFGFSSDTVSGYMDKIAEEVAKGSGSIYKKLAKADITSLLSLGNIQLAAIQQAADAEKNALQENAFMRQVNALDLLEIDEKALQAKLRSLEEQKVAIIENNKSEKDFIKEKGKIVGQEEFKIQQEGLANLSTAIKTVNGDIIILGNVVADTLLQNFAMGMNAGVDFFNQLGNAASTYFNNELMALKKSNEEWLKVYNEKLEVQEKFSLSFAQTKAQEEAIEKEYALRKEQAEEQARQKEIALKRKAWEWEKAIRLTTTAMNIAVAISAVLDKVWMIPIVAAAGLLQLGAILGEKFPEYLEGGYTGDKDKKRIVGGVHGGEFVSNAVVTKKYRSILEQMHDGTYNGGVPILVGAGSGGGNNGMERLFIALLHRLDNPIAPINVFTKSDARKITSIGVSAIKRGE